jgi:hypothetical protein
MQSRWRQQVDDKVTDLIEKRLVELGHGGAADYPQYQMYVGYIKALRDVLEITKTVDQDMIGVN